MKDASYLFLYLIERDFQKLISSSLEENDGIGFNSMTDRSGKDRTTDGLLNHSKNSQITGLICDFSKELRTDPTSYSERGTEKSKEGFNYKGSEDQRRPQTEGETAQGQGQHRPSSQALCLLKETGLQVLQIVYIELKNKPKGTQLNNLTNEI